jgi:peptidoglycan/LPS O-acetylase OafA/YrhL
VAGSGDKLPGLHALRMTAAVAVFVLHVNFYAANFVDSVVSFTQAYFALSVQLFYLVSAFALMHSTRVYGRRQGWIRQFYLKRFWRIAPLFYAVAIVKTAYLSHRLGTVPSLTEIAFNATFLNNFSVRYVTSLVYAGWSVSVEVLFYLMFPLFFFYIRSLKSAAVLTAASIIVAQIAWACLEDIPVLPIGNMAEYSVATNIPFFVMGVFAYLVYERLLMTPWGDPEALPGDRLSFHAVFGALVVALIATDNHFNSWLRARGHIDQIMWGAIFALLALWVTIRPLTIFNWAPIQFLGERSYSIYLLHFNIIVLLKPAIAWVFQACQPRLGDWAMVPAVAMPFVPLVLLATVTYALIESPGMKVGRKLRIRFMAT